MGPPRATPERSSRVASLDCTASAMGLRPTALRVALLAALAVAAARLVHLQAVVIGPKPTDNKHEARVRRVCGALRKAA